MPLVYIIDDSHLQVMILEKILAREGYKVHSFTSAKKLMDRLDRQLPCLIISDIEMPRIDGFELIEKVQNKVGFNKIPFFFISSQADRKTREKAQRVGADLFFEKPLDFSEFSEKIREYTVLT